MNLHGASESIALHRALFMDAVRRGDADTASSVYASDAHLLAPSAQPIVGRDDIRAFWQAGMDAGVADISLIADELKQSDGLACETGAYAFRIASADGAVLERGHYVQVYQRQSDGSWQRTVEIFSPRGGD